ncbi:MAG: hypothetical protein WCX46_03690 [Candidatus Paceibacterota bacterium]
MYSINIFKLIGGLGIILISIGILIRKKKKEDIFFIIGGICLELYLIYINDLIFIILQAIFILTALYDLTRKNKISTRQDLDTMRSLNDRPTPNSPTLE